MRVMKKILYMMMTKRIYMNNIKNILNVFVEHCDSITNNGISASAVSYAILTIFDTHTNIANELSSLVLPQSISSYSLIVDYGTQNGFGTFRFEVYSIDKTGCIIDDSLHKYCSVNTIYEQQADTILFSQLTNMTKEDIIKILLTRKNDLLSRIQHHVSSMCHRIDMCEDCPLHKARKCPNKDNLPCTYDWIQFINTLP